MPFISWSCDQNRSGCNHDQDFIKNAAIMEIWTNWTETGQIGGVSYQQNRGVKWLFRNEKPNSEGSPVQIINCILTLRRC